MKVKEELTQKGEAPFKKLPHEVSSLQEALIRAVKGLINSRAVMTESEEMYAVFDEDTAVDAISMLLVGFARFSSSICCRTVEEKERILLVIIGKRRVEGEPLSHRDLLPESADLRALLERLLRDNDMAYLFSEEGDTLSLTVSFPRFLADRYDLCAADSERVGKRVYRIMLLLTDRK
jgi:hypothetical protein